MLDVVRPAAPDDGKMSSNPVFRDRAGGLAIGAKFLSSCRSEYNTGGRRLCRRASSHAMFAQTHSIITKSWGIRL
jgi:hypothetical protein